MDDVCVFPAPPGPAAIIINYKTDGRPPGPSTEIQEAWSKGSHHPARNSDWLATGGPCHAAWTVRPCSKGLCSADGPLQSLLFAGNVLQGLLQLFALQALHSAVSGLEFIYGNSVLCRLCVLRIVLTAESAGCAINWIWRICRICYPQSLFTTVSVSAISKICV